MRFALLLRCSLLAILAAGGPPAFAQAPVASPAPVSQASLSDLLQMAFSNHPSVQTARANLDAARARVNQAQADYLQAQVRLSQAVGRE